MWALIIILMTMIRIFVPFFFPQKIGKEEIFKSKFQGKFSDQKICKDCPHRWVTVVATVNGNPWRPPDLREETQTAVVWSCVLFIGSGQNHLARHSERGKKTRLTEEEVGRQPQGMDRPGVCQVPEGSGEQGKMEETGCKIIFGAPTTLVVRG